MTSPEGRGFELEEYMEHVELWFTKFEMENPPTKRRIYLATDDPKVMCLGNGVNNTFRQQNWLNFNPFTGYFGPSMFQMSNLCV